MNDDKTEVAQFLGFILEEDSYAIEISKVREVLDFIKIRSIPQMPSFMRGVINLRGSVVPVMDLRIKFDMSIKEDTVNTCIIIVELPIDGEDTSIGIIADSVQEVMTIDRRNIEPAPKLGTRLHADFIQGMCKHNDEFIILLDLVKVFTYEELQVLQAEVGHTIEASEVETVSEVTV